jgi:hypothetical protein
MGYVIYDKTTTCIVSKEYKTPAAAQAELTRRSKIWFQEQYKPLYPTVDRSEDPVFLLGIAEKEYYFRHIERTVTRVNLMTGAEYRESVNTPLACSPASETYWSM